MILRLLVYWGLGIHAAATGLHALAVLCFAIPFTGPFGMWLAMLASGIFFVERFYWGGAIAIGFVAFNLVGNHLTKRHRSHLMTSGGDET
jgi:hypothetical protein